MAAPARSRIAPSTDSPRPDDVNLPARGTRQYHMNLPQDSDPPAQTTDHRTDESSSFHMSIAHLYRGEMHRMTVWRTRIDTTSNWAVLLTIGLTTFTLGSQQVPAYILLLGLALVGICMYLEAHRYQHLHHSKWRIRLLEARYFTELLAPRVSRVGTWRRQLAADLARPRYTLGLVLAMRMRLRRNYLLLTHFITAVWLTKLFIHPHTPVDVYEYWARFALEELFPSWFVALTAGLFIVVSTIAAATAPTEEYLEHWAGRESPLDPVDDT